MTTILKTRQETRLPTFIIIGAMKSGTTSLFRYIKVHPQVCMSSHKETDYFCHQEIYEKGLEWYQSLFERSAEAYGEASPNYTKCHGMPGVPARIHSVLPNVKLIYVLRDPVERMVSHYLHMVARGDEKRPLTEALMTNDGDNHYANVSHYYYQLTQYLDYFDQSQILLLSSEQLRDDTASVMQQVYQFIEVDSTFSSPSFEKAYHRTANKFAEQQPPVQNTIRRWSESLQKRLLRKQMPTKAAKESSDYLERLDTPTKEKLIERLRPDVENLRGFSGQKFAEWCV